MQRILDPSLTLVEQKYEIFFLVKISVKILIFKLQYESIIVQILHS